MDNELFAGHGVKRSVESVIQIEEWGDVGVFFLRKDKRQCSKAKLHCIIHSALNNTSRMELDINPEEGCLDGIDLIGRFRTFFVTDPPTKSVCVSTVDVVFDLVKSGFSNENIGDGIMDIHDAVGLEIGTEFVSIPIRKRKVDEYCYIDHKFAIGFDSNGVMVRMLFDNLTDVERSWFISMGDNK